MNKKKAAIILAAGKGKRMKSDIPKVLHKITGKPLIRYLMETFRKLELEKTVVIVGFKGEMVVAELNDFDVEFVWQKEQLGTGHAVQMAEDKFKDFDGTIIIALGDAPFLSKKSIDTLFNIHEQNNASATCLSDNIENASGYGRIIRKNGSDILLGIVEEKDADDETKKINEINSGTFCFECRDLFDTLYEVKNDNAQQEFYLTDTIEILQNKGKTCAVWTVPDSIEAEGVNNIDQLKNLESELLKKNIKLS
jgi:UDP-N-acetylglucosamine diphosphorylase/glucosamine-1-phosphate N-acetyltransferase